MTTSVLKIRTLEFVKMYKFIVDSHSRDMADAIKHNLKHSERHDMQIGLSPLPFENLRDYIRKTLIRTSENQEVHWIGNRNKIIHIAKANYVKASPYTRPEENEI